MVNKREEERREERKGNDGRKEGERGKSDAAVLRRTQPMGRQKGEAGGDRGRNGGRQRKKKNGAAKNGSELRYY